MKSQADGRGPRNNFTLKRCMAYGISVFIILYFVHAPIQEASISLTILTVFLSAED